MSIEQDIRTEIENIKKLKMAVGEINTHLSALEGLCRDGREESYQKGYEDGKKSYDEAYQKGLDDAWEAARKIAQQWEEDVDSEHRVVIDDSIRVTLDSMTASEAIEKLKACEEKQKAYEEIKVGDEVQNCHEPDVRFGVASIDNLNEEISGFDRNGHTYSCRPKDAWRKTGRHFDIDKILEEMKE